VPDPIGLRRTRRLSNPLNLLWVMPAKGGDRLIITLNGDSRAIPDGLSVDGLLRHLGIESKKVAVERNLEIVPKSAFQATAVAEGDRLEIVAFIGGG